MASASSIGQQRTGLRPDWLAQHLLRMIEGSDETEFESICHEFEAQGRAGGKRIERAEPAQSQEASVVDENRLLDDWVTRRPQYSFDLFLNRFANGIVFFQVDRNNPFAEFLKPILAALPANQQLFTNRNLGDFSARGGTSALTYLLLPGLELTANYTLLERVTATGQSQIGVGNVRNSVREARVASDVPVGELEDSVPRELTRADPRTRAPGKHHVVRSVGRSGASGPDAVRPGVPDLGRTV